MISKLVLVYTYALALITDKRVYFRSLKHIVKEVFMQLLDCCTTFEPLTRYCYLMQGGVDHMKTSGVLAITLITDCNGKYYTFNLSVFAAILTVRVK